MPVYQIPETLAFPCVSEAEPDGLLGVGGDLSPERLLLAYSSGIFPWFNDSTPILWFSPDPRTVLAPGDLHVSRSFRKFLRRQSWSLRMDTEFAAVIEGCRAAPRPTQDGTWITEDMIEAYDRLHALGFAHSVEVFAEGELIGGLYGVSLGGVFFGESMYSGQPGSSQAAFVWLARQLQQWGFNMIDCQFQAPHLERWGAREISRDDFLLRLDQGLGKDTRRGLWDFDEGLVSNEAQASA